MEIKVLNVEEFLKFVQAKEVTTSSFFIPNTSEAHPEGLISNEIFGLPGTPERREKYGYIDLGDWFFNPHVLYVFSRLKSRIAKDMVDGVGKYYIDGLGELTPLEEGATVPETAKSDVGTGIIWLRKNWDKIDWLPRKLKSKQGSERRRFMNLMTKELAFINKIPVIPAFYRDVDLRSLKRHEINSLFYERILGLASMIKSSQVLFFGGDDASVTSEGHKKMQKIISDAYTYFVEKIAGGNAFIHDHVMGKTTDFGARMVISAPRMNFDKPDQLESDFTHTSVPLSVVINIFSPFMKYGIVKFIESYIRGSKHIYTFDKKTKEVKMRNLAPDFMEEFSGDNLTKMFKLYNNSKLFRIQEFTLKGEDKERIPAFFIARPNQLPDTDESQESEDITYGDFEIVPAVESNSLFNLKEYKTLTMCELLYIVAEQTLGEKHLYQTRYPVDDINGQYPSKINIIPSYRYNERTVGGFVYKRYPNLSGVNKDNVDHAFSDSLKMFTTYLPGLDGDYDGDQVSIKPTYTEEANAEADGRIKSMANILGVDGKISRPLTTVVQHGLYALTYKYPLSEK